MIIIRTLTKGWVGGIKELKHVKFLKQCLDIYSKCSLTACYYDVRVYMEKLTNCKRPHVNVLQHEGLS